MTHPDKILEFWLDELDPQDWYNSTPELDALTRKKFETTWDEAAAGSLSLWLTYPTGTLAYVILLDQLPRNMFRDQAKAFSSDKIALAAAKSAIEKGWDLKIDEPARQFFYLPLMHSESQADQDRCVRLMHERMPEQGAPNLLHAQAHREVIRRFGRFPFRNEALGRNSSGPEIEFINSGGYGRVVQDLQSPA